MKSHNNHEDRWSIHVPNQNKEVSIYSLLYKCLRSLYKICQFKKSNLRVLYKAHCRYYLLSHSVEKVEGQRTQKVPETSPERRPPESWWQSRVSITDWGHRDLYNLMIGLHGFFSKYWLNKRISPEEDTLLRIIEYILYPWPPTSPHKQSSNIFWN